MPLQNLENESYDREFEPKEPDTPIETTFEASETLENDYPDDSMNQMMEKLVQLETNNQLFDEFISSNLSDEKSEPKESIEENVPEDSMEQMMEKIVQLETNNQIPSEFISSTATFERQMLPMPSNDPASFMSPVPAGPLMDVPIENEKDMPPLEANPYFRSRKMNFHMKPIILSVVSVALFIGVFISIFAILYAFK